MVKKSHPYVNISDSAKWSRAIARTVMSDVDPVVDFPQFIKKTDKIATAGSCFAQHLARRLSSMGYNYYVPEQASSLLEESEAKKHNYGLFSARYGNIYTARQLRQLFDRAFGKYVPVDDHWNTVGVFIDPLRPTTQPGGFRTLAELRLDREYHLKKVREMFENLDIFIFTLGLTEAWENVEDGCVYPICPGTAEGVFDPQKHRFHNFTYEETLNDMKMFVDALRGVNPTAKIILTVSPVPLVATAEHRHVLVSTTYSKSVLRVVCDTMNSLYDDLFYFPSYEIITGNFSGGAYYADDLREVTEQGVDHVMRIFGKHFLSSPNQAEPVAVSTQTERSRSIQEISKEFVRVECDERHLDNI